MTAPQSVSASNVGNTARADAPIDSPAGSAPAQGDRRHGSAASGRVPTRATRGSNWYQSAAARYSLAILLVIVGRAIIGAIWHFSSSAPFTVYLAVVVLASLHGGLGPGVVATVLASLSLDYDYMPPYGSFVLSFANFLYLSGFFAVALVISSLQGRRRQAESSLRSAHEELERRVTERTAELLNSREQFSLLVNGVNDQAFFMLDADGNVASWNAGAERLLGFQEGQIIGQPLTRIWPDGFRMEAAAGTSAASWPVDRYEYNDWISRGDGGRFWGCIFLTEVQDETGRPRGRAIAVRDITERKSLERDILEISERERLRIGHDLHDGLGQELTGLALLSTALAERLAEDGVTSGSDEAERIADLVHDSIRHTRDLARGLCPLDLEDEGLPAALRQLTDQLSRVPRFRCEYEAPQRLRVDAGTGSHLYRIAQEAINNAVRHGKGNSLSVRLTDTPQRLTLTIADDGAGIADVNSGEGMGLRLMKYRAKMIRGTLDVRRGDNGGTVVTCAIDKQPGDRGD
jgi:two-component system CheB/CheR fusion protein